MTIELGIFDTSLPVRIQFSSIANPCRARSALIDVVQKDFAFPSPFSFSLDNNNIHKLEIIEGAKSMHCNANPR